MPKTYDEKREAFDRMLATRLPKAVKAIELLSNLSRKSDYAWTNDVLQEMLDQIDDAVDGVAQSFGAGSSSPAPETEEVAETREVAATSKEPGGEVDLDQRAEVRWAYDAVKRGDSKLAKERLHRVIETWIEEDN